jgi:hypothetical protein
MSVGQNLFGRGLHLYLFSGNDCLGEARTVTLTNNPVCFWDGVLIWRSFMIVSPPSLPPPPPPSTPTRAIAIFGLLTEVGDGEETTANEWAELDLVVSSGGHSSSSFIGICDAIEGQELAQPDTAHWDDFPREWHFIRAIHGMTSCTYTNNAAPARETGTLSCPGLSVSCPPVSGASIGVCTSGSIFLPSFFPFLPGIEIGGGVSTFELLTICQW